MADAAATLRVMAADDPLISRLAHFRGFDRSCRPSLDGLFSGSRSVARRRDVIRDGVDADEVFLLLEGWAARYKILAAGERQITSFLLPGDVFPIHAGPTGRMDHAVGALTRCRLATVPARRFQKELLHDPKLAQAFWWITIADKDILRAWVVNLGHRSAYSRIAHLLCELATRLQMIGRSDGSSFDCPLTQQEIADAEGLTVVHTNRMLTRLRADRLIDWSGTRVTILNPQALRTAAEFDPAYLNPGANTAAGP